MRQAISQVNCKHLPLLKAAGGQEHAAFRRPCFIHFSGACWPCAVSAPAGCICKLERKRDSLGHLEKFSNPKVLGTRSVMRNEVTCTVACSNHQNKASALHVLATAASAACAAGIANIPTPLKTSKNAAHSCISTSFYCGAPRARPSPQCGWGGGWDVITWEN